MVAAYYFSSVVAANKRAVEGLKYDVDKNTTDFKPMPEPSLENLKNMPNIPDVISLNPVMAKIAKSNEWGFTTGPLVYQQIGLPKKYGEYLSVWKRNKKSDWKIALKPNIQNQNA